MTLYVQSRELRLSREMAELSRKELELTRNELKNSADSLAAQNDAINHQRFEQTFFAWLQSYRSLVESIHYSRLQKEFEPRNVHYAVQVFNGRKALREAQQEYMNGHLVLKNAVTSGLIQPHLDGDWVGVVSRLSEKEYDGMRIAFINQRDKLFANGFRGAISPAISTIEQLLRWIDTQTKFSTEQRCFYAGVVATHLSGIELFFLLVAALGDEWPHLPNLLAKYGLLDQLDGSIDPCVPLIVHSYKKAYEESDN